MKDYYMNFWHVTWKEFKELSDITTLKLLPFLLIFQFLFMTISFLNANIYIKCKNINIVDTELFLNRITTNFFP